MLELFVFLRSMLLLRAAWHLPNPVQLAQRVARFVHALRSEQSLHVFPAEVGVGVGVVDQSAVEKHEATTALHQRPRLARAPAAQSAASHRCLVLMVPM